MKTTNFPVGSKILLILLIVASQSAIGQDWNGGDVKWQMNCNFPGHELERISGKGEECGGLCIASPQCTHFNHADGFCHLKNASLSTLRTVAPGGMCGFIPWRLESGKDHWNTEADGLKWFVNCDFVGHNIGRERSSANNCGGICLANPQCSHFRHFDGFCYLKKAPLSISRTAVSDGVCGYIPSRDNKETIDSKDFCECNCL